MRFSPLFALAIIGCGSSGKVGDSPRVHAESSISGWKEVRTAGIHISFPKDWQYLELESADLDAQLDKLVKDNPGASDTVAMARQSAANNELKLLVIADEFSRPGFKANCGVFLRPVQSGTTLEYLTDQTVVEAAPMLLPGTRAEVGYLTTKAGRFAKIAYYSQANQVPLKLTAYLVLGHGSVACIVFGAPESSPAAFEEIAAKSIETFRFAN